LALEHFRLCYSLLATCVVINGKALAFRVEEPHYFYAAPGKNFDAAPAAPAAPAPTLLYSKGKIFKTK
jgi:hypothetical protein